MAEEEKRGIAAEEMDELKRSCGILRRGRIRNEVIKRKIVKQLRRKHRANSSFGMDM